MRVLSSLALVLALTHGLAGAEHTWKPGVWAFPADGRTYVVESATDFITGEVAESDTSTITVTVGDAVQYAVEQSTLVLLDGQNREHTLRLVGSARKYSSTYSAAGGGHYIKSVARDGSRVTLEDGSRWDIDARLRFAVAEWAPDDLISIRRSNDEAAFAFEIDNTSRDDGALANHLIR
ncbi:MAG: hypothetical protein U0Q11_12920 [Vicinamibacterales bacterium]